MAQVDGLIEMLADAFAEIYTKSSVDLLLGARLSRAADLSDLSDKDAAISNLGGNTHGRDILKNASATGAAVAKSADADAGLTALGANTSGRNIFKNATTLGATLAKIADAAAGRVAISAPAIPQTATGSGQFVSSTGGSGVAFTLPAGGTWVWWGFGASTGTGAINVNPSCGVVAGGTTVLAAVGGTAWVAYAWRVA